VNLAFQDQISRHVKLPLCPSCTLQSPRQTSNTVIVSREFFGSTGIDTYSGRAIAATQQHLNMEAKQGRGRILSTHYKFHIAANFTAYIKQCYTHTRSLVTLLVASVSSSPPCLPRFHFLLTVQSFHLPLEWQLWVLI
jgi:hypothetical protein